MASAKELLSTLRRLEFERDDYVDDRINGTSIPFHDEHLYSYRSIEIPERRLSIEECESIVDYIIDRSHTPGIEFNAMKHLAYLAYNSLLDVVAPNDGILANVKQVTSESDPLMVPFFHKYRHYTEDWLQVKGGGSSRLFADILSDGNGTTTMKQGTGVDSKFQSTTTTTTSIKLIHQNASLYERKATIGAWAFGFLAAIKMESEGAEREYTRPTKLLGQMMQVYSIGPAYKFELVPYLNQNHLSYLDEELLFIVLRGAIILENILYEPSMLAQRGLLFDLAYYALRGHCMALMNWFNDAAFILQVPVECLIDDMNELLLEVGLVVLARNVRVLRRVHREYVLNELAQSRQPNVDGIDSCNFKPSRYYMYARLFLHQYFHCFGDKHNETTIAILAKIKEFSRGQTIIDGYSEVNNDEYEKPVINVLASLIFNKHCIHNSA